MEKIWTRHYCPGVPAQIDASSVQTVVELFEGSCQRYAAQTAYINMGVAMSYEELDRKSLEFARYLRSAGLAKGDRVALMMPNVLQYPITLFGTLRAGCVVVNCNPLYTPRELAHQLKDSGAKMIVVLENFAHTVEKVLDQTAIKHVVITPLGEMLGAVKGSLVNLVVKHIKKIVPAYSIAKAINLKRALSQGRSDSRPLDEVSLSDTAFLQYTGGTTGVAKAAVLTHQNIGANVAQAMAWIKPAVSPGKEFIVTALPLYHIFALTANCLTYMCIGAQNLLITNPRDFPAFIKEWSRYPEITTFTGVNTLFNALMNQPAFASLDFSKLHLTLGGGMAVQKSVADRWQKMTGCPLIQAYGLTETSPAATINPILNRPFNGSIGLPIPSTEVSIRDEAGKELGFGEIGEISLKGPQITAQYWQQPEETRLVFWEDGFLKTGDMGYINEEGYVFLVDRKKDMILVSGFNVYPNEIEDAVMLHPGILEAAAIGIADEQCGEVVKLFVVAASPDVTEQSILAHCREHLTSYKIPRQIEFRSELPKTNVGKILRRALRDH